MKSTFYSYYSCNSLHLKKISMEFKFNKFAFKLENFRKLECARISGNNAISTNGNNSYSIKLYTLKTIKKIICKLLALLTYTEYSLNILKQ